MTTKAEIGTLIVVVLKARNLNDKHFYKQDVYAQVALSGVKQKTQTDVKGGQHPVWDAELRYQVLKDASEKNRTMEISCFSVERRKDDDLLGRGTVDITETLKTGEFDDWVPLSIDGVQRGDVYLEMTFFSNAPPPPAPAPAPAAAPRPHAVVPSRPLQIPQNGGLMRRPSKLPEHERLARLTQASPPRSNIRPGGGGGHGRYTNPNGYGNGYSGHRLDVPSPHSSRSSSAESGRAESPLPPLPDESKPLPNTLLPAGGRRPAGHTPPQVYAASPPKAPPNTLRPGGPPAAAQGSSNPYTRRPDPSPSRNDYRPPPITQQSLENNPYVRGGPSPAPSAEPYYERVASPQTAIPAYYGGGGGFERVSSPQTALPPPQVNYAPPPSVAPVAGPQYNAGYNPAGSPPPQAQVAIGPQYATGYNPITSPPPQIQSSWSAPTTEAASFAFPVPSITPAPPRPSYAPPPVHYSPPQPSSPYRPAANDGLPDPYLQARYQTPLPLPPGANSPPRGRQPRPAPEAPAAPQSAPPKPAPAAPPASSRKAEPRVSEAEQIRLETQRIEEEEEARRVAQEKRDMELALQLDRELNLG